MLSFSFVLSLSLKLSLTLIFSPSHSFSLRHLEEVDILRALSTPKPHPNVIAFVDAWEQSHQLFIQMELCELGNLAFFLEEYGRVVERLDEGRVWKIIRELSEVSLSPFVFLSSPLLLSLADLFLSRLCFPGSRPHPLSRYHSPRSQTRQHLHHHRWSPQDRRLRSLDAMSSSGFGDDSERRWVGRRCDPWIDGEGMGEGGR